MNEKHGECGDCQHWTLRNDSNPSEKAGLCDVRDDVTPHYWKACEKYAKKEEA